MDKKKMIIAIIMVGFALIGIPINYFFFHDYPDNAFEELIEKDIKDLTGEDIDLSPWHPEHNKNQ